MEYMEISVHTNISSLADSPPIISEPDEILKDPAVFVALGSQSAAFS